LFANKLLLPRKVNTWRTYVVDVHIRISDIESKGVIEE